MSVPLQQSHDKKSKYTLNDGKKDFLTKYYRKVKIEEGTLQTKNYTASHSYYPGKAISIRILTELLPHRIIRISKHFTSISAFLRKNDHSDNLPWYSYFKLFIDMVNLFNVVWFLAVLVIIWSSFSTVLSCGSQIFTAVFSFPGIFWVDRAVMQFPKLCVSCCPL